MGQAKRRGTFEQRQEEAIAKKIESDRLRAEYEAMHPTKPSSGTWAALLALSMIGNPIHR